MITHIEDPGEDRDDQLVTLLRPGGESLAPPPGTLEAIRRRAAGRRRLRAVVGAGLTLACAAAVAWPLYLSGVPVRSGPTLVPPAAGTREPRTPATTTSPAPREAPTADPTPTLARPTSTSSSSAVPSAVAPRRPTAVAGTQ